MRSTKVLNEQMVQQHAVVFRADTITLTYEDVCCIHRRMWRMRQMFKKLDLNQSGTLEVEEITQLASNMVPFDPTPRALTYFKWAALPLHARSQPCKGSTHLLLLVQWPEAWTRRHMCVL